MSSTPLTMSWVVLTMGDRPEALAAALESLGCWCGQPVEVIVIVNGSTEPIDVPDTVTVVVQPTNLGIPGGRDVGARMASGDIVGFLDDDAVLLGDVADVIEAFERSPDLGVVALRLVDEHGATTRRHVPRLGAGGADRSGPVATFLGGACAIRRSAYDSVGGYYVDLFYGHEELELSWRAVDGGWAIEYLADCRVQHPRTEVSRHADGWGRTGRNRVLVARRTLPWPVAIVHVVAWLALGLMRAPDRSLRRAYATAWLEAWRVEVDRHPIHWLTVWRLARLGRPPVI